jgi:hypothetical protein
MWDVRCGMRDAGCGIRKPQVKSQCISVARGFFFTPRWRDAPLHNFRIKRVIETGFRRGMSLNRDSNESITGYPQVISWIFNPDHNILSYLTLLTTFPRGLHFPSVASLWPKFAADWRPISKPFQQRMGYFPMSWDISLCKGARQGFDTLAQAQLRGRWGRVRQAKESRHCQGCLGLGCLGSDYLMESRGLGTGNTGPKRRNNDHNTRQSLSIGLSSAAAVDITRRMTPVHGPG